MSARMISGLASGVARAVCSGVWSVSFSAVTDAPAPRRRVTMVGRSAAWRVCAWSSWVRRGGPTAVWSGVLSWFEGRLTSAPCWRSSATIGARWELMAWWRGGCCAGDASFGLVPRSRIPWTMRVAPQEQKYWSGV